MYFIKKTLLFFLLLNIFSFAEDSSDTFDIMYVYTTAAKNRVGGTANMRKLIHDTIVRFNQSFANSNMDLNINLVHTEEISYQEDTFNLTSSAKYRTTLSRLKNNNDGYIDRVHILRDMYSADLVHMFIENNAYGGLGYIGIPFSVSSVNVRVSNPLVYAMKSCIHEVGHNMGLYHASDRAYPLYARGYTTSNLGTIMGANYINYWSSPDVTYNGIVTGTVDNDARRAILEKAPIIANFRQRPITTAPTLTTTPPAITYANTLILEINGTPSYEVYVNGVKHGTLDANGKATINLDNLSIGENSFNIQLKDPVSGTLSTALTLTISKKNIAPIMIPIYYMILN